MTSDKNKGITSIEYNYLNLPTKVEFGSSNNRIEWTYTVSGVKLEKRVYTSGNLTLTQNYVSGFVYKNGILDFFSTETGRIKRKSNGTLGYEYTLADHLGNARVTFADDDANGAAETLEYSAYYAFGMRIEGLSTSNPDNKFTYNGKELENDLGLNWYHYGARFYDPQLGRWHVVDPHDEFNSPYLALGNNPVKFLDPDGKDVYSFDTQGNMLRRIPSEGQDRFFVSNIIGDPDNYTIVMSEIKMDSELGYLSRVVYAEAGGASQLGKEIVADVVQTRVEIGSKGGYKNTYEGVITQVWPKKEGGESYAFSALIPSNEKYENPQFNKFYKPLEQTDPAEKAQFANSVSAAIKIYYNDPNTANGADRYYSPNHRDLNGKPPKDWDFSKLNETTPVGAEEEFKTYKPD